MPRTPDEGSQGGCTMPGVFYCSEKGQAIPQSCCRAFIRDAPAGCRGSRNEMPSPGKGIPWAWHEQGAASLYPRPDNKYFLYIPQSIPRGLRHFFIRYISISFPIMLQKNIVCIKERGYRDSGGVRRPSGSGN